ncbi:hypothetical protein [Janthinobacterium psychrotolerans]|uniref:Uncharacterized protein n=1 Tax=Janthinobacterium psychrotolerans TaxID=1747903 RepID=A0A1A7BV84_9BURK|nr:hypothetical protein [Janthinobacterium psychrotolerans]OBV37412.1 hypothetical protein ASR47_100372 [Janthinobacterium psychrotolerans]
MTIAKHIEAVAIAIIAVAAAASMATASVPKAVAHADTSAEAVTTHVVYVSAKRLSAAEKAAL